MAVIKGTEKLMNKMYNLRNIDPAVVNAMRKETLRVQRNAVMLCPANSGELRQTIKTKVKPRNGLITGIVYTNNKHAAYVEFGTGPVGESDHEGISPNVNPKYSSKDGWWFPGKKIPPQDAEKYHWPSMTAEDGKTLYFTKGQPAQPFLYPALKFYEDSICENIKKALAADIKKL